MIKLVMFDMDGVLFDSMPVHSASWVKCLVPRGIQMEALEIYDMEGATAREMAAYFYKRTFGKDIPEDLRDEICAQKSQCVLDHGKIPLVDGAYDVVKAVKEAGVTPSVVTGSAQMSLYGKIEKHFDSMFCGDWMVTAHDVKKGKPSPEPYLTGMKKAGVSAVESIVVENAPLGVQSAKAAGAYTIAVNTGPLPDSSLWNAGADKVFPSMGALAAEIKDIIASL